MTTNNIYSSTGASSSSSIAPCAADMIPSATTSSLRINLVDSSAATSATTATVNDMNGSAGSAGSNANNRNLNLAGTGNLGGSSNLPDFPPINTASSGAAAAASSNNLDYGSSGGDNSNLSIHTRDVTTNNNYGSTGDITPSAADSIPTGANNFGLISNTSSARCAETDTLEPSTRRGTTSDDERSSSGERNSRIFFLFFFWLLFCFRA